MNTDFIKFGHFTSIENYCFLQSHFEAHDMSYPFFEKREKPSKDLVIKDYELDDFQNDVQSEIFFIKDFVIPGLDNIHLRYFNNFKKEIDAKGLFTSDLLKGYVNNYIEKISKTRKQVLKSDYLGVTIQATLLKRLDSLNDLVEEYIENPYPNIQSKIKFNWKRVEVIYFFHLLRLNKSIEFIKDSDIGRILNSVFEYYDDNEEKYKPIKSSRKLFNDFKNTTSKSGQKSNNNLRKRFKNDDFYNH